MWADNVVSCVQGWKEKHGSTRFCPSHTDLHLASTRRMPPATFLHPPPPWPPPPPGSFISTPFSIGFHHYRISFGLLLGCLPASRCYMTNWRWVIFQSSPEFNRGRWSAVYGVSSWCGNISSVTVSQNMCPPTHVWWQQEEEEEQREEEEVMSPLQRMQAVCHLMAELGIYLMRQMHL